MENAKTIIVTKPEGNGFAVAGLVLGIIGIVLNLIPFLPYILGILAIIFGVVGLKKPVGSKMSKVALVLGAVTIAMKVLFWVFIIVLGSLGNI